MKRFACCLCAGLAAFAGSCARRPEANGPAKRKTLTAVQYQLLRDQEKLDYKDIVVRVPESWGGALLPFSAGPFASPADKAVHSGELMTLMGLYNQSLFELQNPRVRIEYINFDMWSDNFRSALAVALSANRAPAYYIARDLPQTIEQGMYADLTDLMKGWDQFDRQPEGSIRQGTFNGRIYTMAANELGAGVIRYRKDFFRDAGIFNERGEPGPPSNWTWEQFREIAKKLSDPAKGRFGYAGQMGDFLYNEAHGLELYVPDPAGKRTWKFNADDPELRESLQAARAMVNVDKSVTTSVTMGWFEWHNEFDAGHAAMVSSFAPHIPRECLDSPEKFGKDRPYPQTVGMAVPPQDATGYSGLAPITNPIGFDPTLSKEQLAAAFAWCQSWFYGDIFLNRMRAAVQDAKVKGRRSSMYAEILALPYQPRESLLDVPLEKIFPADYLETYRRIKEAHSPPLPREFGLKEPPANEFNKAVKALYSDAITRPNEDLKALIARHAALIDATVLSFQSPDDGEKLRRYVAARDRFYRTYHPRFWREKWLPKKERLYRIPQRS